MAKKQSPRNWIRYDFINDNKIIHSGITKNPERREAEHKDRFGSGKLRKVGPKVTEESAKKWEESKRKTITHRRGNK